jgi:hypothetical protein
MTASEAGISVVAEVVKEMFPTSRDTFHLCYYARSEKANLLDNGIDDTLVLSALDNVTLISHGKRVNLRTRFKDSM